MFDVMLRDLVIAASRSDEKYVKELQDLGNINKRDANGNTPLMTSITRGNYDRSILLTKAGANIFLRNNRSESALHLIANNNLLPNDDLLRIFIRIVAKHYSGNKVKIAERLMEANWPLDRILLARDAELTKIALNRGYENQILLRRGVEQCTALHVAARNADVDNVRLLLKYTSYEDALDQHQRTPMAYVYDATADKAEQKLEILRMLLAQTHGTLTRVQDFDSLLRHADRKAVELLLRHGINIHLTDWAGDNAVHCLARNRNPGAIEQLGARRFNVNARNASGETALMLAVNFLNYNAVTFLLDRGADIRTALLYVVEDLFESVEDRRRCLCLLLVSSANNSNRARIDGYHVIFRLITTESNDWSFDILTAYLALEQVRGAPINEFIRRIVYTDFRLQPYFDHVDKLFALKVYGSLTLLDFLTESERRFEAHARLEELVDKLKRFIVTKCHSYYLQIFLKKRLSNAIQTAALKRVAGQIICKLMDINYNRLPFIADEIMQYLDQQSIYKLIDTYT